ALPICRVDELAAVCARHGVALPLAALRFPLRHRAVTSVVLGARTPAEAEAEANVAHAGAEIPDTLWAELDELAAAW
ncbi:aldo/keto reductase, partial [Actinophytocola sp.]|uniref:aldo/keto reductase n=1 Tax=Actinophytocola sp. TaxID=1872138 RepID=UPI00389A2AA5